jgi:K+/H+ antiporter YhaU regulatory subunit KhtT
MSFWNKIRIGLEEGLEVLSEKSVEWSKLAKLKWARRSLQKEIFQEMADLGGKVYELHIRGRSDRLTENSKENVKNLAALKKQLEDNEAEIQGLTEKIDKFQVKGFKKDLEMGDGTIEQIVIRDDSRLIDKKLMDIRFPKNVLVGTIIRDEKVLIPDGQTVFMKGDRVTLLGTKADVEDVMKKLGKESS